MIGRTTFLITLVSLSASPALAQAGTTIPEPSDALLFGLGLAGLVIGRHFARRKPGE
ncbi:PEP-CTERM sorting domain-containing protein [Novosphingobium sp. B 225]|uniref:PEP-CTERM sorting domain-containing protein n=1 Tax=Novosphingobium sp. B 225 TaxID=1961849 RepID=UPI000B4BC7CB|nr:PEP-CTERM sorting domain-containing protein [Novosphingobium sp. B 225]